MQFSEKEKTVTSSLSQLKGSEIVTTKNSLPFYRCPRYNRCSVNNCPLHPIYPDLQTDEEDVEKKCGVAKSIRIRIAGEFTGVLKFNGLTAGEYKAKQRYENMSDENKTKMKESLSKINSKLVIEVNERSQHDPTCKV